jgi:very-short-patch-repair endonuclease
MLFRDANGGGRRGTVPRTVRSNPRTRTHAIELRKDLTDAEVKLWAYLRKDQLGVNFRRQHAIGKFICDFVCIGRKLIIELDGSQHIEQQEYDAERSMYLQSQGYQVLRFWNDDVMNNINSVIKAIQLKLENKPQEKPDDQ